MNRIFTLLLAASCLTAVGQLPDYVPTEGLMAWYPFNGNTNDAGTDGYDGTSFGVELVEDRFTIGNSAIKCGNDGSPTWVELPQSLQTSSLDFTLSFWLNPNSVSGRSEVVSRDQDPQNDGDWSFSVVDSVLFFETRIGNGPTNFVGGGVVGTSSWSNVVVRRSASIGENQIYLNGLLVASGAEPYGSLNPSNSIHIGRHAVVSSVFYQGDFDDFGIWNRALSEEEIFALFNAPSPTTGCVDENACNYDSTAVIDDGSCLYLDACGECGGEGTSGCIDSYACNFDLEAACDDGSCDYACCPGPGCCTEGMYWDWELSGCYNINPADINFDGCVQLNDLLDLLSAYGDCGAEESPWQCGDPLEYQGYDYETVQIGEQCWFAENLRAENYRNGDIIPDGFSASQWSALSEGARAVYGNNDANLLDFGYMFNWRSTVDERGLCPSGWHVPSHQDHLELVSALNQINEGCALVTEEVGLGMKYGGYRARDGSFTKLNVAGYYWSTSPETEGKSWGFAVYPTQCNGATTLTNEMFTWGHWIEEGFSIRCIKDAE